LMTNRRKAEKEVSKRLMGICIIRFMRVCFVKEKDVQKSQRGVI
jgi:hypothetical protein